MRVALRRAVFLVVSLALLAACGASPKRAPIPPTPTPVTGPRVVLPSGSVYKVELARTPEETAYGLMFRESLPDRAGMLFLFSDEAPHRFWMKNTMIPLDIVWVDGDGGVTFVSENTPPCRQDPCPSYGPETPASIVLEIAGGKAAQEGIRVGSKLRILDVPPPAPRPR